MNECKDFINACIWHSDFPVGGAQKGQFFFHLLESHCIFPACVYERDQQVTFACPLSPVMLLAPLESRPPDIVLHSGTQSLVWSRLLPLPALSCTTPAFFIRPSIHFVMSLPSKGFAHAVVFSLLQCFPWLLPSPH